MKCPIYFPDLLEQFMSTCNETEHWATVEEFRTKLSIDKTFALAISGFLRRLYNNPTVPGRYTVVRIENLKVYQPQRKTIHRYLIRERAMNASIKSPE